MTFPDVRQAAAVALLALLPVAAAAQTQRSFVASSGVDTDPCTFAQPCRSFAAAIAQTNDGGEVIVLDSAGYGAVTIGQSASIIAAPGVYAGVTVFTGSGITVAGIGTRVRLSGLTINGQGGDTGIYFQQGAKLAVDHCLISDLNFYGIYVQASNSTWIVTDTTLSSNGAYGLIAETGSGTLDRVRAENNASVGIYVNTASSVFVRALIRNTVATGNGSGISVFSGSGRFATVTVEKSSAFANGGMGFLGTTSGGVTQLALRDSDASANTGSGVLASGAGATVSVTASTLVQNVNFGMEQGAGAVLRSLQNNTVEDNNAGPTWGTITNGTLI